MESSYTPNYFDFRNKNHKHFFAGLLNTALNNFDLSLNELGKRINKKNVDKGFIRTAFKDELTDADFNTRVSYLAESLKFIDYLNYTNRKDFRNKLYLLYETIDTLRNYYTHFNHEAHYVDSKVYSLLDDLLFQSAFQTKMNRAKTEENKSFLSVKYKDDLEAIVAEKNKKVDEYNAQQKDNKKKQRKIKEQDETNFVLNHIFKRFLYNDDGKDELKKSAGSKEKDKNELSLNGFLQLVALFLNKKDLESLLDHTKYYKDSRTLEFIVSRWTLSFLCYRDIRKLFRSDYSNDSLLLQMVAELGKCPDEIFKLLSNDKKQLFIEEIQKQKRYENKFPYFAIRFLDEIMDFPNLRFQVSLGKFQHDTKSKSEDTRFETERKILENITVFEKLTTATSKKIDYFKEKSDEPEDEEWLKFPYPSYQFNGNNIGIWLKTGKDAHESNAAKERANNKNTKFEIAEKLGLQDALLQPVAYLSFNELPALLYELLVNGKQEKDIEEIIKQKINLQKQALSKFPNEYEKNKNKLPKRLAKAFENNGEYIDKAKLKRDIQIEKEKEPLREIRNKYRFKTKEPSVLSDYEKGQIATWLTDDIKRFCRKDTRKNIKGHQVATLQALIAFFQYRKNDIKTYLTEEMQIDLNEDNPFKGIDLSKDTLMSFYDHYIKKRKHFLDDLSKKMENTTIKKDDKVFDHFTLKRYFIKDIEEQKNTFQKEEPFNLPRGIFDDKPTFVNKRKSQDTPLADWFRESNDAAQVQSFYHFDKHYQFNPNDKRPIHQKIVCNRGLKAQYHNRLVEKHQKEIYKHEKEIRRTMREDFFVMQMVKHSLRNSLKDTYIDNLKRSDFFNKNKRNSDEEDSHILSRRIHLSLLNDRIKGDVKIKDIGKYRKLEADERVKQLVRYFSEEQLPLSIESVSNEMEVYDKVRKFKLFKDVHEFENKIFQKAQASNEIDHLKNEENLNFKKYVNYGMVVQNQQKDFLDLKIDNVNITSVSDLLKKPYLIVKIRNKFSHNQLLYKEDFDYLRNDFDLEDEEFIADFIYRSFRELVDFDGDN